LKDSQPDPNGTVYLGEGAWGAIRTHWAPANVDITEKIKASNSVWVIKVFGESKQIQFTALNEHNEIIDEFNFEN
jgi:hypothetical protein